MPMRFGKYTLLRKLATGGMAELFLAIQRSVAGFEKLIVIKRILPQMTQDRAFIEMLLHEARVAATLSHPNIVQIFDVGEVDGTYYIAMEHVHGEDLRQIVRQMKRRAVLDFPIEHALAITLGVCAGLAYAHEKTELDGTPLNIVHRDISPQNVVVTFSGDVKIVDFGIAKSDTKEGEGTKSGKLKGKVPYMSPEQARALPIDHRSDIFATGVMLFELTTGKRLFKGASEYDTLKLICEKEYPLPSQVRPGYPPDLEQIVLTALAKDPAQRYQSARHMQADLESFVRRHQIAVSGIALQQFMQGLFEEKLAAQKQALLEGKQLADIIDSHRASEQDLEMTMERRLSLTQSMPAAAHTVTDFPARRGGGLGLVAVMLGLAGLLLLGALGGFVWVRRQTAKATAAAEANAALHRGAVEITSEPAGASIWINGDLRPEVTPATIGGLPVGAPLDIKLTKDGFEHARHSLQLATGAPAAPVKLELKKGSVVVQLTVKPEGVPAYSSVDGKTFDGMIDGITSGDAHKLVVGAPGYVEQTIGFQGNPMETKRFDVLLEKAPVAVAAKPTASATGAATAPPPPPPPTQPQGNGKLNVAASGGWCNVAVDGAPRGATPVAGIELSAGTHRITCTTQDGKTMNASVNVPVDGVARYKFSL
jgi:serine/threonine-protein kinase